MNSRFKRYLSLNIHNENATVKKCLGGIITKKTMTVTTACRGMERNKISSLDVYLLGVKIWHQEKESCLGKGAIEALEAHQEFPLF